MRRIEGVDVVATSGDVSLGPELEDHGAEMVRSRAVRFCRRVMRYPASPFLRARLGSALAVRGVMPHGSDGPDADTGPTWPAGA